MFGEVSSRNYIKEKSMSNYPESILMNEKDYQLPLVYPVAGSITINCFDDILSILCDTVFPFGDYVKKPTYSDVLKGLKSTRDRPIYHLKNEISKCPNAVLFNKKEKKTRIDLKVRDSRRLTFDNTVMSRLEEVLLPVIEDTIKKKSNIEIEDVRIDPTHGDMLYYGNGGKFDIHRDGINEFPFDDCDGADYRMYSLILCLDSNLSKTNTSLEGNTIVYLPEQSFLPYCNLGHKQDYISIDQKCMFRHDFKQSCTPKNFVIFPAEALHASCEINDKFGYKLALKFDIWIKELSIDYSQKMLGLGLVPNENDPFYIFEYCYLVDKNCECKKCQIVLTKKETYSNNLLRILKGALCYDTVMYISDFLVIDYQVPRCLVLEKNFYNYDKISQCTCQRCYNACQDHEDEDYYSDHDYESDCNGYQYDY